MSEKFKPKILIFSTEGISDPAIDLTGLLHKNYPVTTSIIRLPCSSMIRPDYILYALKSGFDGVFIAADGTDCPYLKDCTERTAKRVDEALKLLKKEGFEQTRLKMAAICSVCVEPFIKHITEFHHTLMKLGPVKKDKGGSTE
ncbi:MAG: hydrogenase iron-sulfur subunit [Candidatus Odinarchaeota archaeon]|nr:hydrogenase iron-sulfur subunit [Candidatus Odinarchaeota archaeon]